VAGRILGQGDVVALVERAAADFDIAKAETMARRLSKGQFDLDDLSQQLLQMEKMGGMEGLMGLLPGVQKVKQQIAQAGVTDKSIARQRAIIGSMTKRERKKPDILAASRKRRIAAGAGVDVAEVNRLLKQHRQMQDAFKAMARGGGKGFARMAGMLGMGMPGGGKPADALKMLSSGQLSAPDAGAPVPPQPPSPVLPGLGGAPFNPFRKP
jgi:signal recognition particle subunit SRP54